eukprot:TRINITY_DN52200_c0_g1_i1.p1 TRINITY_DN52200_c0_g1~~TRINITY_DN52200_c0_g1_i1.p1  ORF type:complete len:180 (+),score=37.04 TRINITY_DN52200_c0_g1_i1:97-636(+)
MPTAASMSAAQAVRKRFQEWDINGNGTIEKAEFARILEECGMSLASLDRIFEICDLDGNGHVSWEEFIRWVFDIRGENVSYDPSQRVAAVLSERIRCNEVVKSQARAVKARQAVLRKPPLEVLKGRFPDCSEKEIKTALEKTGGHGGKAASLLEKSIKHGPADESTGPSLIPDPIASLS